MGVWKRSITERIFNPLASRTTLVRAFAATGSEKIVVSWLKWPDKESFHASESRMHDDNALEVHCEIPFDTTRLIFGCF